MIIIIPRATLIYPSIYEGRRFPQNEDARIKYNTTFDTDCFESVKQLSKAGVDRKGGKDYYSTSSVFRPLVTEIHDDYELLEKTMARADLRNIARDKLFAMLPAIVAVEPFVAQFQGREYRGIAALEVRIDAAQIALALSNYTIGKGRK